MLKWVFSLILYTPNSLSVSLTNYNNPSASPWLLQRSVVVMATPVVCLAGWLWGCYQAGRWVWASPLTHSLKKGRKEKNRGLLSKRSKTQIYTLSVRGLYRSFFRQTTSSQDPAYCKTDQWLITRFWSAVWSPAEPLPSLQQPAP